MTDSAQFLTRLPDWLLNPSEENPFVFFVGAGVSMGPPMRYPNFAGLADKIADYSGEDSYKKYYKSTKPKPPLDQYLGQLAEKNNIHQFTQELFDKPFDERLPLHETLIDIFRCAKVPIRIVTTNFDQCFESSLRHLGVPANDCPVYSAPALPLDEDGFFGLAHIHGSAAHPNPKTLILTQQDFGRAYLNPDWAKKFLLKIFNKYNVVFVGYSHNDTIINYLTHSLYTESTKKRYIVLGEKESPNQNFTYLRLEPLVYSQKSPKDYSGLPRCLEAWKTQLSMNFSDKKNRTIDIADTEPTHLDRIDIDFLKRVTFKDEALIPCFFEKAKKIDWIDWFDEKKLLEELFIPNRELLRLQRSLAWWLSVCIHNSDEHYLRVLKLILKHSGNIHTVLIDNLVRECQNLENSQQFSQLGIFLVRHLSPNDSFGLGSLLLKALENEEYTIALVIIEKLLVPVLIYSELIESTEIEWSAHNRKNYYLKLALQKLNQLQRELALPLMEILIGSVQKIETEGLLWSGSSPFKFSFIKRPAIEEHGQNQNKNLLVLLTEMLRDTLEYLLQSTPDEGSRYIKIMENSNIQLLERLAIYAVSEMA